MQRGPVPSITKEQFLKLISILSTDSKLNEFLENNVAMVEQFLYSADVMSAIIGSLHSEQAVAFIERHNIALSPYTNEDDVVNIMTAFFNTQFSYSSAKIVDVTEFLEKNKTEVARIRKVDHLIAILNLLSDNLYHYSFKIDDDNTIAELRKRLINVLSPSLAALDIDSVCALLNKLEWSSSYYKGEVFAASLKRLIIRAVSPNVKTWSEIAKLVKCAHSPRSFAAEVYTDQWAALNQKYKTYNARLYNSTTAILPPVDRQGFLDILTALRETYCWDEARKFIDTYHEFVTQSMHDAEVMRKVIEFVDLNKVLLTLNVKLNHFADDADKFAIARLILNKFKQPDQIEEMLQYLHDNKDGMFAIQDLHQAFAIFWEAKNLIKQSARNDSEKLSKLTEKLLGIFETTFLKVKDFDVALDFMKACKENDDKQSSISFATTKLPFAVHDWNELLTVLPLVPAEAVNAVIANHKLHWELENFHEKNREEAGARRKMDEEMERRSFSFHPAL